MGNFLEAVLLFKYPVALPITEYNIRIQDLASHVPRLIQLIYELGEVIEKGNVPNDPDTIARYSG